MSAYQELERRFRRLSNLRDALGLLRWDSATMMPVGGAEARAEQMATLEVVCHEILTDPGLADLLAAAGQETDLGRWQAANLREMRRQWRHATAVGADLVQALTKAAAASEMVWRQARPANDFQAVLAPFEKLLALVRESAEAKADRLGCAPYDALIDQWEPAGRTETIDPLFDDLAAFLEDFIGQVVDHQAARPPVLALDGPFPIAAQRRLAEKLATAVGFDFAHGRLDESLHPFSSGVPEDVRITTRYSKDDFTRGLMAVLHETGHALYDRGLPGEWRHQPVGEARGMSLHEGQSLLIEMQACRSPEFLAFAAPLMREAFGRDGPAWQPDNLYRLYTRVEAGLIRVDADEVTYPLHVILRYRLERAMLAGDLALADLPGAWNDGMRELLGLAPPDDRDGCLQDIHWYEGAWGYFPTYTLGAMTAAQLFDAARRAGPEIAPGIARGDFRPLVHWLGEHVHAKGSLLSADELLTEATGRPLDPEIYKAHLKARYLA